MSHPFTDTTALRLTASLLVIHDGHTLDCVVTYYKWRGRYVIVRASAR